MWNEVGLVACCSMWAAVVHTKEGYNVCGHHQHSVWQLSLQRIGPWMKVPLAQMFHLKENETIGISV